MAAAVGGIVCWVCGVFVFVYQGSVGCRGHVVREDGTLARQNHMTAIAERDA